jgi:voltage-gated potassium channel
MIILLVVLCLLFSSDFYLAELNSENGNITSCTEALYWGIAAFSTAGIADTPGSWLPG